MNILREICISAGLVLKEAEEDDALPAEITGGDSIDLPDESETELQKSVKGSEEQPATDDEAAAEDEPPAEEPEEKEALTVQELFKQAEEKGSLKQYQQLQLFDCREATKDQKVVLKGREAPDCAEGRVPRAPL